MPAGYNEPPFKYTNITTDTTTTVKSGIGLLHAVVINTAAATEVITIFDNTAASGTKIGTITVVAGQAVTVFYDVGFNTGLTIQTATAASDITVVWV
jgi:hypothetical protein